MLKKVGGELCQKLCVCLCQSSLDSIERNQGFQLHCSCTFIVAHARAHTHTQTHTQACTHRRSFHLVLADKGFVELPPSSRPRRARCRAVGASGESRGSDLVYQNAVGRLRQATGTHHRQHLGLFLRHSGGQVDGATAGGGATGGGSTGGGATARVFGLASGGERGERGGRERGGRELCGLLLLAPVQKQVGALEVVAQSRRRVHFKCQRQIYACSVRVMRISLICVSFFAFCSISVMRARIAHTPSRSWGSV
jgi:hypothetical protein